MGRWPATMTVAVLVATLVTGGASSGTEDAAMDERLEYRWNLAEIYPDDAAWTRALEAFEARIGKVDACRGHLGDSPARLADCLDLLHDLDREAKRLGSYAGMRFDEDTREAGALEMRQRFRAVATRLAQATSWVDPEILQLGAGRVRAMIAAEPRLEPYRFTLEETLRRAPHTLSPEGERLVATAGLMADAPSTVYSVLANAEMPWPTVTLSDGTEVRLDQAAYTRYRAAPVRADRKRVFDAFFGTWKAYERTLGAALHAQLRRDLFYAQARRYPSCLAAALDGDDVPEAVYRTLLEQARAHLGTLHRYLRLRGRLLGIPDLRYYDVYPPLVRLEREFGIEEAKRLVLEAVAPLGPEYVAAVRRGFESRWMDVFPRPGKRSGAYSNGSIYDLHPYLLLNFNDDWESVSTLAHEWGHAMHSYLANRAQPYPTADYSIFVAEVASTLNEALLLDAALRHAADDRERLFYLGSALEGLRGTFFRQAMFAEFELAVHEAVERGEALSGRRFSEIYGELLRRYHGHDRGVLTVDDAYTVEWAYIPHFYYDFYVYQYATSIAAAQLLAERILAGEPGASERYLALLEAGGSRHPYELLREAGVDLATPAPYEALVRRMERIMDEIEAILERRPELAATAP